MRCFKRAVLSLAVTACLTAPALAQPGPGGFGRGFGGPLTHLSNKSVQAELKLSDEQKKKVEDANKKISDLRREKFQGLTREDFGNQEKMAKLNKEISDATAKEVKGIDLKSEQEKRLQEITYQQMRTRAFSDEKVQAALKFTDEQKESIKKIGEEQRKAVEEATKGLNPFRDREKFTEATNKVGKETEGKIAKVLTDSQKASWKEMKGEAFDYKQDPRPMRPGGGTGRPGGNRPPGGGTNPTPPRRPDF